MADIDRMKCVRWLLFIFIGAFWLFAIGMFSLGIYVVSGTHSAVEVSDTSTHTFGGLLVAVGVIAIVLGFAGFYGAWKDNRQCLILYASVVAIIFMMEVIAGSLAIHYRHDLKDDLRKGMKRTLARSSTGSSIFKQWNTVQKDFKCCGVNNYTDWQDNGTAWEKENHNATQFPYSCCAGHGSSDYCTSETPGFFNSKACYDSIYNKLRSKWKSFAAAAIAIGILQISGVIFSCLYQKQLQERVGYKEV